MKRISKKICFICSGGGHLEQINQLKVIDEKYDCFYVLSKSVVTQKFKKRKYLVNDLNRKNKITKVISMLLLAIHEGLIFAKEDPDVIITTGAALAIPMCLYGKIFKKKTVYIESFARMKSCNRTGKFLYGKVDLFVVQWEELLKHYPKAVYGGWIY